YRYHSRLRVTWPVAGADPSGADAGASGFGKPRPSRQVLGSVSVRQSRPAAGKRQANGAAADLARQLVYSRFVGKDAFDPGLAWAGTVEVAGGRFGRPSAQAGPRFGSS